MEERIRELEELSEKLWDEFMEERKVFGADSKMARLAGREWCNLWEVLSYIRGENIGKYDYLVREMLN